jgi:hypothetical protein
MREQAAGAAQRSAGLDTAGGFLAAFAHFELGRRDDALETFLHAALNHPRAARMLVGEKMRRKQAAKSREDAEDHNVGVSLLRGLHAYLRRQSRASRRFFRDIMRDARIMRLLDEIATVVHRWHDQHRTGERDAFDRMQLMRSHVFAKAETAKLRDLLAAPGLWVGAAIH